MKHLGVGFGLFVTLLFLTLVSSTVFASSTSCSGDCVTEMAEFYDLFYSNPSLNIYATRNDGVIENYWINLDNGKIMLGLSPDFDGEIYMTEETLDSLLLSDNLLLDFKKKIDSKEIDYTFKKKGIVKLVSKLFKGIGGLFSKKEATCFDKNPCTEDYRSWGRCKHKLLNSETKCGTDMVCNNGECVSIDVANVKQSGIKKLDCDDNNPCTLDITNPDGTCSYKIYSNNKICGDNKLCKSGVCK